jgi:hypothetical protein
MLGCFIPIDPLVLREPQHPETWVHENIIGILRAKLLMALYFLKRSSDPGNPEILMIERRLRIGVIPLEFTRMVWVGSAVSVP